MESWDWDIRMKNNTNTEKCMACKFWLYFKNEKRERCSIKGCWNNSKYVPYTVEEGNEAN